ncbi:MAG: MazG nucleotide pyrophosphohydrolase domain-containing protein [bacterium]|nr:MazG nucleotide pyrophosphohydrolase domain-containing protein [bacterium]
MISAELLDLLTRAMQRLHDDHHDEDLDKTKLMHLAKLNEEVGELAQQILGSCQAQQLRAEKNKEFTKENLAKEGGDVLITTMILLLSQGVDINEAIQKRVQTISERLKIG